MDEREHHVKCNSQTGKDKYHVFSHMWKWKKKKKKDQKVEEGLKRETGEEEERVGKRRVDRIKA
jgi:hypothetical protein